MHDSNQRENIRMQRHPRGKKEDLSFRNKRREVQSRCNRQNTGIINDIYLMKYTKEGPIFSKQTYSRWKEELAKAKAQQLTIITLL